MLRDNLSKSKEQKLEVDNITLFENEILQVKNYIMTEKIRLMNAKKEFWISEMMWRIWRLTVKMIIIII